MAATRKLTTGAVVPGDTWVDLVDAEVDDVWLHTVNHLTGVAGTSTVYTATATPDFAADTLTLGVIVVFAPHVTCGASPTLNIDGVGAFPIAKPDGTSDGTSIEAGDLILNNPYLLQFRNTHFMLLSANQGDIDAIEAEVVAARSGQATLDLRIDNVARDSINVAPQETVLTDTDRFTFTDGDDSFLLKRIQWQTLRVRAYEILGALIAAASAKATLASGDDFLIADSEAADANKRMPWSTILAQTRVAFGPTINAGATAKSTVLANADTVLIADSEATNETKKVSYGTLVASMRHNFGPSIIVGATAKTTLADADNFVIADSEDGTLSFATKKVTWTALKADLGAASATELDALEAEVVAARSGAASLDARIDAIATTAGGAATDAEFTALQTEVVNAREGQTSLDAKLDIMETATTTVSDEVVTARSGKATLDLRIDDVVKDSINAAPAKSTNLPNADAFIIADSEAGNVSKKVTYGTLISSARHNFGPSVIAGATAKTTLVNADSFVIADSEDGTLPFATKKVSWGTLKGEVATAAELEALEAEVHTARSGFGSLDGRIDSIATEVTNARGEETTLERRLDDLDNLIDATHEEVVTARSGFGSLDGRIDTIATEVANARGTETTLERRLDDVDVLLNATANEVITARSGQTTLDARIDSIVSTGADTDTEIAGLHDQIEDMPLSWRPGRNPRLFTTFESHDLTDAQVAAQLVGTIDDWEPLDESLTFIDSQDGAEVRIVNEHVVAMREPFRIETGRTYKIRAVVRRRTDTYDPAQDGVRIAVQGLNANQAGAAGTAMVVATLVDLTVASGRVEVSAILATAAGEGVDLVAPAGAIYGRLYAQFWGSNPTTALQVLAVDDITDSEFVAPDVDALQAQLDALLSEDTVTRIEALEADSTGSQIARFPTATDAAAATIGATIDLVETFGRVAIDDTEGGIYERAVVPGAGSGKFQSADGQWWEFTQRDFTKASDRAALAAFPASHHSAWLGEAGREGWFRWTAGDLSAKVTLDPFQGVYVAPTSAPTGASGAWVRVRDKTFVNIDWFGAKPWEFGDFTANMQSALDFAAREEGECYIPAKIYMQSATLHMKRSCWLHGSGNWSWGYRPLSTYTGGVYGSRLVWTTAVIPGAAAMPQILVESDPQGDRLLQPRVTDLIVDGDGRAGYGIYISASEQPVVDHMHLEQHVIASLAFLPRGSSCVGPTWDNIFINARTRPEVINAVGILMNATSASDFNTGGHGGYAHVSMTPAYKETTQWAMKIGNQDAFLLDKFECGGGNGIWFTYNPAFGGGLSKKHIISYFAGGQIRTDPGCCALDINGASEGTILNLDPDSQIMLRSMDQTTGDAYRSHQYNFTDEYELRPNGAVLTAGATLGDIGGVAQAIVLAEGAAQAATWTHVGPPEWNHGRIMGLRLIYGMSTANPGASCHLRVTVRCPRTNGTTSIAGSDIEFVRSERFLLPGAAVADTLYTQDLEIAWPPAFKKRCAVNVTIQRVADGSEIILPDTSTQDLKIVAVREMYKADGPNANVGEAVNAQYGYFETGKWSREVGYSEHVGGPYSPTTGFETEAITLIDALDPDPWKLQQILINKTVKDLKDAGLWTAFDMLYLLGSQEKPWSYINWIAPGTRTLAEITAAPRFTRLQGYRALNDGYLSPNVNWAALTKYTQNNCHAGAFVHTEGTSTGAVFGSTSMAIAIYPRHLTAGDLITRCNAATNDNLAMTSSRGHFMINRSTSTGYEQWVRGALAGSPVRTSAAVINEPVLICRATHQNTTHDVTAFHCGRALTALEATNLARILAYHVGHMTG